MAFGVMTSPVGTDTAAEDLDEEGLDEPNDGEYQPISAGDHTGNSGAALTTTLLAVMETLKGLRTALYIIIVLLLAILVAWML